MKKNYLTKLRTISRLIFTILLFKQNLISQTVTQTFTHTGAVQNFTIPPCVAAMTIDVRAAAGGNGGSNGANGGAVRGVITGTPGTVLFLYVGGQGSITAGGFNGGGAGGISSGSSGAGGGGGSDVRLGGTAIANRIIVAGGGGGGGGATTYVPLGGAGGAGSAFTSATGFGGAGAVSSCGTGLNGGESGGLATAYGSGGGGAGFSSGGGGGGAPSSSTGGYGCTGALGAGGAGGGTSFICGGATGGVNGGGGGGGGYYGGGGGMTGTGGCNGGGGGGSSWINTSYFSASTFTSGISAGNGTITITYVFLTTNVSASTSSASICSGGSTTLNGAGVVTYTWLPVGTFTGSNSQNILVNPTVTTVYTVTGTNSLSCISDNIITVTVSPGLPVLTFTANTTNTCQGTSVLLTASGALTYTWTGGVTNGVSFVPLTTSGYTVTGGNGCGTSTAATAVTISPLPVNVSSTSSLLCAGSPATLSAVSSGTAYTWQPFSLPGANVVVTPAASTIFTVTASNGICSGTATLNLSTIPIPTIVASASSSFICQGAVVTLTASGGLNYTWTPGNLSGNSVTVSPTTPTSYSVGANNSQGCFSGASAVVIVNQAPTLNVISADPVICSGSSTTLTAGGTSNTYSWSSGGTAASVVVNPLATTNYTVVGVNTTNSCSATQTIDVSVFTPTVTITGNQTICNGASTSLTGNGGTTYTWNPGGTTFTNNSVSPTVTSTYTLSSLTASGNVNCPASTTVQVVVNQNPSVTATSARAEICKNESVTLTAGGAVSYVWSTTPAQTTATITATSSLITIMFYTVTGTSSQGCSTSTVVQVKVNSCNGIGESKRLNNQLVIYPNPSKGDINIQSKEETKVHVINSLGQLVKQLELNAANGYKETISELSNGVYYFVGQNNSQGFNQKIIVTK
jgi:hypothetical protein